VLTRQLQRVIDQKHASRVSSSSYDCTVSSAYDQKHASHVSSSSYDQEHASHTFSPGPGAVDADQRSWPGSRAAISEVGGRGGERGGGGGGGVAGIRPGAAHATHEKDLAIKILRDRETERGREREGEGGSEKERQAPARHQPGSPDRGLLNKWLQEEEAAASGPMCC
jgi:hypothetical protein